ncbi:MAG: translation initiation factor eIF-1A [Candidatus Pacearchaeota archaeon]
MRDWKIKDKEEDKEKGGEEGEEGEEKEVRVLLPRENQVIGIVERRLGGNKMQVECTDGNTRVARVPGRFKKKLWIRPNDVVLIEKWELEGDKKGDIIYKYSPAAVEKLKEMGLLKKF